MIRSFKIIRKQLLFHLIKPAPSGAGGNRLSKYFFYTVGKIALVVIGILIPLLVNNWNETRIAERRSVEYLKEMKKDLSADTLELDLKINWVYEVLERYKWHLSKTNYNTTNVDILKLIVYSNYPDFYIHDITFQKLKNSDNTGLVGFNSLNKLVSKYYN